MAYNISNIVLNRIINEEIKKGLNEAIGCGFSFGYLKTIPSFKKRYEFCKKCLGPTIGSGSSRVCFQLTDELILKLALNEKGIAQNEQEGGSDYYRDSFEIFPQVNEKFSDMDNWTFITTQYVLPAKERDFQKILGMSSRDFYNFLRQCATAYSRKGRKTFSDEDFDKMCENNEYLNDWYSYMCDYQVTPLDLRNANFGITLNGGEPRIVMLDNGVNDYIMDKYYRR